MKRVNSIFYRLIQFVTKNYSVTQKEKFLAGMLFFISKKDNAETKNKLRLLLYDERLKPYPVVGYEERLRYYGWFEMISNMQKVEGDIVEAGTGYGNTLITFLSANAYFNSSKKIYAFDSFEGFPIPHLNDIGSKVQPNEKILGWDDASPALIEDSILFHTTKNVLKLNAASIIFRKGFFKDTMPQGLPEKISLLHVDNDLYEGVLQVLHSSFKRLQPNAVVIFDEYHDEKWPGVKKAVDEFAEIFKLNIQYFPSLLRFGFIKSVETT